MRFIHHLSRETLYIPPTFLEIILVYIFLQIPVPLEMMCRFALIRTLQIRPMSVEPIHCPIHCLPSGMFPLTPPYHTSYTTAHTPLPLSYNPFSLPPRLNFFILTTQCSPPSLQYSSLSLNSALAPTSSALPCFLRTFYLSTSSNILAYL